MQKKFYQEPSIKSVTAALKVDILNFEETQTQSMPIDTEHPVDPGQALAPEMKSVWDESEE